jgi:hypothetical protein
MVEWSKSNYCISDTGGKNKQNQGVLYFGVEKLTNDD